MSKSGDIYQRLDKLENDLKWETKFRESSTNYIPGLVYDVSLIMFVAKAAATFYCTRTFTAWLLKKLRRED